MNNTNVNNTNVTPNSQTLDLSVVVPCYNESRNIPELVSRLEKVFAKKGIRGEIVLVDDKSKDNTKEVIQQFAQDHDCVRGVYHEVNQGIAGAWNSGVAAAAGEYVCLIDADLQNLPEDVSRLYREIKFSHVDMVQGYRSSVGRLKNSRYILSRGFNFLLNTLFGMRLKDNKSGFVIADRDTMIDCLRHRMHYYFYNSFIAVSAHSRGYAIREIETLFQNRLHGESYLTNFPGGTITKCLVDMAKGFFEFRLAPKQENLTADFLKKNPAPRADEPLPFLRAAWFKAFFLTMPLHKWMITRRAELYYKELKQSQWLSPEKMKELQELKLRKLVTHAYKHVPFYRQRFDEAGIKPSDIRTIEDLQKVPMLSKADVRENIYFDLLSDNHRKDRILRIQTSGSTGEPFVCFADQHQLEIRWAATQRSLEWTGYRFGDRQARLWHQTLGMSTLQVMREKLDAWFNRRLFVPAYELSDKNLSKFVEAIRKHQPVLIDGYAESFNFLAHYLKQHNLEGLHPKGIMSSAQALPEQSREIIENSFKCGVFDKYGSREFSGIAYECDAHQGHHVVGESYIVEIMKDGRPAKPGEVGEVLITDLNNLCLPMIRYRVGDLAEAMDDTKACACGRGLPRIGRIEGRVQAIIVGTNGNFVPGTFFAHVFKDFDQIVRQYQVVQEQVGQMTLKIIKATSFDEAGFAQVITVLKQFLGDDMRIDVQFVDHIPMVRTGKQQGSISKIPVDMQIANAARFVKLEEIQQQKQAGNM